MIFKRLTKLLIVCTLLVTSLPSFGYNVLDRFKLLEDKFETEEMLRKNGHDFFLDISAYANKNLPDFIDDAQDVADTEGDTNAKVEAGQEILRKWDKTEQTARVGVGIGIPLPTFHAWGIKFVPDFRIHASWGANIGIRSETITPSTLKELIPQDETAIRDATADIGDSEFNDIRNNYDGDVVAYLIATDPNFTEANAGHLRDKYVIPDDLDAPNIFAFTKLDGKAGFLFNYFKDHIFGHWHLYGLHRTDYMTRLTAQSLARDQDILAADDLNSQLFLTTDYTIGYRNANYRVWAGVEELKIARLADNLEEGGDLNYEMDPLFRLHGDAKFKWGGFSVYPFAGFHKREGYDFDDGLYAGTDVGFHVWNDSVGVRLRGMVDPEHFTFSPQIRLAFLQLEYTLRNPIVDEVDDVETSAIHSLNLRLFF